MRALAPISVFVLLSLPSAAIQRFSLQIDPAQSTVAFDASIGVELPGSVIGNWDRTDNPRGTRTVLGLGGGPGNEAIPMDLGLSSTTDFVRMPMGGMELDVDEGGLTVAVAALELDLLGGQAATNELTLSLLYSTFRSFQPDSLYIGGIPLDLPLGEQALTEARVVQSGAAGIGVLTPTGVAGEYTYSVSVPVELTLAIEAAGNPVPIGPLPILLPLSGELTLAAGNAELALTFDVPVDQTLRDPLPGFVIEDAPFDLPTILPPGDTARLLLTATIESISIGADLSASILASGPSVCGFDSYCAAVPNSSGAASWLEAFGTPDAGAGDLMFVAQGLPVDTMGYFVMSTTATFEPGYRGHVGNLCLGPRQIRFAHDVLVSGPEGSVSFAPDYNDLPNGVEFLPGSTWHFQLWYRDLDPGPTWNSSDGMRVQFCTGE